MAAMLDLSKKKKKKKKKEKKTEEGGEDGESVLSAVPVEEFDEEDRRANYEYEDLLHR